MLEGLQLLYSHFNPLMSMFFGNVFQNSKSVF
uniref:Uncharacterized protein n=1 Tax=Anguilla anguilla TaxID=7936 RepID=A0A0E9PS60_ANGAN